jgi:signal transduction histidine kinase
VKIVALVVTIPPLLLATTLRDRLGLWVDLALNGVHYKIEKVIASVGEALAGVIDEEGLAHVVVRRLPSVLLIQQAALWLPTDDGRWRLVAHSHRPDARGTILPQSEEAFFDQPQTVEVIESPHDLESDPTPWQVILRFRTNGERPLGVALFGARLREKFYSGRDVHTLTTLASWITTTIVNINVLAKQRTAAERERQLMQKLAETEEDTRITLAAELHDQGISALSLVRLMVNQKREPALVVAAIERVIKDLRGITDNRVNPSGLGQGLAQALEAMTDKQRYTGIPVTFSLAEGYEEPPSLSLLGRRELYYVAQEAVVNAVKHAQASQITVSLSRAGDTVQLSITDNGKGFDAKGLLGGRATRGVGIMQARASSVGGKFSIGSQPGQGTTVRVEWSPSN